MNFSTVNEKIIQSLYKRRENWSHKGNFGRVLVIGGNQTYTGSPALVALAAYRSGADIVKILAPKRAADICAGFSPEIISIAYNKSDLDEGAFQHVSVLSENSNVVSIGNGLGTGNDQKILVNEVLNEIKKRLVVDADAVKILDKSLLDHNMLITPNSNEFKVLFDVDPPTDLSERIRCVVDTAKKYHTNILLKGHVDVISDGEETFINKTNSVYMTKGGTGDTLTGICAGLIAQGNEVLHAAAAAAFINGYTGRAVSRVKKEALSPLDIINNVYDTITKWRHN